MLLMTTLMNDQCYQCVLDWGETSDIEDLDFALSLHLFVATPRVLL